MRKLLFGIILCFNLTGNDALAQGPNNTGTYYKYAHGRKGADLKTAMYRIIKEPNVVTYGNGLKMGYVKTDTRPDGYLRDFYSNITNYVPGSDMAAGEYEGFNYNREHTVCQSWFQSQSPMYSDIVMVIPTDGYVNSRRNNNPFGEVTSKADNIKTSANGYSKWGAPREGLGQPVEVTTVFEPNDEVKGDIARIYFYMATCYQDRATTFTNGTGQYVFNAEGTAYQPLQPWVLSMMMRWSEIDPVDSIEQARNDSVFVVQGNRNPFVDYPGLEDYVWGTKTEELFSYDGSEATGPYVEDEEPAVSGTIILNNTFFGVDWTGQRPSGGVTQMKGKQGGITITYSKGSSGQNMFCNDKCIRLYKYNEFTIAVANNEMVEVEFNVTANANNKVFWASEGEINGYKWTGKADEVQFRVDDGNGNIQVASVTIGLAVDTGIDFVTPPSVASDHIYNMQGVCVDGQDLRPGIYIKNGKKIIIR